MGYCTAALYAEMLFLSRGYPSQMDDQSAQRRRKLEALRERGINPYPNDFKPDHLAIQIHRAHADQDNEALSKLSITYRLAGRVMAVRMFGKAAFLKLSDRSGTIQVMVQENILGNEAFEIFKKFIEVGDLIGIVGKPVRTRTNELSIQAEELCIVTKSLRPLPEKWHGLTDVEIRYRQRYVDLMVNPDVREIFRLRANTLRLIRAFFDSRDFLEVETPMMHSLAGGATARPFITHHNALDMDLYLRVAPELFLKRLLVGGLERVYEVNRNFRNEGVSTRHNPEFTMLEFYQAYATYQDLIILTEELMASLVQDLKGKQTLSYQGVEINFKPPYRQVTVREALAEHVRVPPDKLADAAFVRALADKLDVPYAPDWTSGKVLMALFEEKVEAQLVQPTFVCDFPLDLSPLSRKKEGAPELVDRFELYIAGREIANAFSELNDPDDQRERFNQQMNAKASGDEEAMPYDEDYIRALEYGMPPAGGEGIGIDRLVMVLADVPSIRDVILFPLLRPER
jgi:lysyl-tRNA synthetase class 2